MNADNDEPTNITPFPVPNRDKLMLLCGCGCETFNLIANGTMECAYCSEVVEDTSSSRWIERMPVPTHNDHVETGDDFTRNSYMRTAEFARRKIIKQIVHWSDNRQLAMALGYNEEGAGHLWVDVHNEEQREWVLRKLMKLHEYVQNIPLEGPREVEYVPSKEPENDSTQETQPEELGTPAVETGEAQTASGGASDTGDASSS